MTVNYPATPHPNLTALPQQIHETPPPPPCEEENEEEISPLRQAVNEWQEKIFKGHGALSEEEIEERINCFIRKWHPGTDATQEQLASFYDDLTAYERLLRCTENTMPLLSSAQGDEESNYLKSLLPTNLPLKNQLTPQQ